VWGLPHYHNIEQVGRGADGVRLRLSFARDQCVIQGFERSRWRGGRYRVLNVEQMGCCLR